MNKCFAFKEFKIISSKHDFPVRTYPNLLASWALKHLTLKPISVLDVGCGSGILGSVFAHKYEAKIFGIDINPLAIYQSESNYLINGWGHLANFYNHSFEKFYSLFPKLTFDSIFCKPPYVDSHNKKNARIKARHTIDHFFFYGFIHFF